MVRPSGESVAPVVPSGSKGSQVEPISFTTASTGVGNAMETCTAEPAGTTLPTLMARAPMGPDMPSGSAGSVAGPAGVTTTVRPAGTDTVTVWAPTVIVLTGPGWVPPPPPPWPCVHAEINATSVSAVAITSVRLPPSHDKPSRRI